MTGNTSAAKGPTEHWSLVSKDRCRILKSFGKVFDTSSPVLRLEYSDGQGRNCLAFIVPDKYAHRVSGFCVLIAKACPPFSKDYAIAVRSLPTFSVAQEFVKENSSKFYSWLTDTHALGSYYYYGRRAYPMEFWAVVEENYEHWYSLDRYQIHKSGYSYTMGLEEYPKPISLVSDVDNELLDNLTYSFQKVDGTDLKKLVVRYCNPSGSLMNITIRSTAWPLTLYWMDVHATFLAETMHEFTSSGRGGILAAIEGELNSVYNGHANQCFSEMKVQHSTSEEVAKAAMVHEDKVEKVEASPVPAQRHPWSRWASVMNSGDIDFRVTMDCVLEISGMFKDTLSIEGLCSPAAAKEFAEEALPHLQALAALYREKKSK